MTISKSTAYLERCPVCLTAPVLESNGRVWTGGCAAHFPDAVYQPFEMFDQAVIQWNRMVSDFKGGK